VKWVSAKDVMAVASARSAMARAVRKGCSRSLFARNAVTPAIARYAKAEAERNVEIQHGPTMRNSSAVNVSWITVLTGREGAEAL